MSYGLSCVLLIPAAHVVAINALADSLGYGPNNLAVELVDPSAARWYGCHTWCNELFLQSFGDQPASPELSALVVSVADCSISPAEHWALALEENGLADIPAHAA